MDMQAAIKLVTENKDLSSDEMIDVMRLIMTGEASPAQVGGFLVGLRMKGETVDEISSAAAVMRGLSSKVVIDKSPLVDTCGTGGDGASTFNISTASAFVVAAAGGYVAKHGNRSISSSSGSADVLEAAGVNINLNPEQVAACVEQVGVGFMFAQKHHSAMKHAIGPRKEMAVRTIFNLLGPLTNPADAACQVIGVFSKDWVCPLAEVLKQLGSSHVLIVHAEDGLDEISIGSATYVAELLDGNISEYVIEPEQFGLQKADVAQLAVTDAKQSLAIIKAVFAGEKGPARDIVALNAGAAIYAADLVNELDEGVAQAQQILDDGSAQQKLDALIQLSNQ
ncbi:Anthranilate phosphoribosyltransferase [hydrothermal vent metagenome]|uniref:anthranilate phosphoribosyltransferase n=1 Tax=hydrothermal vent metagenome TaxID=652676 RepID=A0A3B0YLH1_9ZZZZ